MPHVILASHAASGLACDDVWLSEFLYYTYYYHYYAGERNTDRHRESNNHDHRSLHPSSINILPIPLSISLQLSHLILGEDRQVTRILVSAVLDEEQTMRPAFFF